MQILLPVTVPVRPVISVGYCTTLQFPGVVKDRTAGTFVKAEK